MSTLNEKMTALANEVRNLSGDTSAKSIDTMTSDINTANTEITEQADLIAQIATALENKAAGGVTLPELSNPASASDILSGKEAIDADGEKITGTIATQGAKTITPSTSSQTAVSSGVYTTGEITVDAIPSNYEDVTNETNVYTTKLESLETAITALETALENKTAGSGGASVETCTVTITIDSSSRLLIYAYSYIEDEKIISVYQDYGTPITNTVLTLNNVACGSLLYLSGIGGMSPVISYSNNISRIDTNGYSSANAMCIAPTSNGETGTITLYDDD